MTAPGSVYRLADTEVLIAVAETPEGPAPLATDVEGESAVVAWTDLEAAQADLPDTHRLFSLPVSELLAQLPPTAGLLLDPRTPEPVYVSPADAPQVLAAAAPFPAGAETRVGDPEQEPTALLEEVRRRAASAPWLRTLRRTWYQVADADPKLLVLFETDDDVRYAPEAGDLVVGAAEAVEHPGPLMVLAWTDVPDDVRGWLEENTPPFHRAG